MASDGGLGLSIDVDDGSLARANGAASKLKTELQDQLQQLAQEVVQTMQANADAAFVKGYSTGATRDSISVEFEGPLAFRVGPNTSYAPYVEYGTRKMEAEPFVGPTMQTMAPAIKSYVRAAIMRAMG